MLSEIIEKNCLQKENMYCISCILPAYANCNIFLIIRMASFKGNSNTIKCLEEKIKHCELSNVPLNISNKIGEGGYAHVYKLTIRNKDAAVKILKTQLSKKKVLEVAIELRKLKHSNVVRFRGYTLRPSGFVFELCELKVDEETVIHNVSQLVQLFNDNDHFNLMERLDIILQGAKGLQYLHHQNVVHKDFKPENCLVSGTLDNLVIKVSDFDEIVEIKNTITSTLTINKKLIGMTLSYVAPEIFLGKKLASKSSDIYALALSCFVILNNTYGSPWKNVIPLLSDTLLLQAIKDGKRPYIEETCRIYKENPAQLLKIIKKAWSQDEHLRPDIDQVCTYLYTCFHIF